MKYTIVRMGEGGSLVDVFDDASVVAGVEALGFPRNGSVAETPTLRRELCGQPRFDGLFGPMFDGGGCRYEDYKTMELLSQ